MYEDDDNDDDTSDEEALVMKNLFRPINYRNESFYFKGIEISQFSDLRTAVTFFFAVNSINIETTSYFDGVIYSDMSKSISHIGMCLLIWFWMGFGSEKVVISRNLGLCESDLSFWSDFYNEVLLEYFYCNNMRYNIKLELENHNMRKDPFVHLPQRNAPEIIDGILLPLGGGKDSIVAWKMAKDSEKDVHLLYVENELDEFTKNSKIQKTIELMDDSYSLVTHNFDIPIFLKYCRSDIKLCGHPWAALVLFDAVLIAQQHGLSNISLGFEKSANEGNGIMWCGKEVNHQYDKSANFLEKAIGYLQTSPQLPLFTCTIYSPLMNLWELEIMRLFCSSVDLIPFHGCFLSCNEPIQYTQWCLHCEKCVFIIMLLSAFLDFDRLEQVFGCNPWVENTKIDSHYFLSTMKLLMGLDSSSTKPFECVGTALEAQHALQLTVQSYWSNKLMDQWQKQCDGGEMEATSQFQKNWILQHLPPTMSIAIQWLEDPFQFLHRSVEDYLDCSNP